MNSKLKNDYLKFGRLLEQEHQLREKIKAIQEKCLPGGRWTCTERHQGGYVVSIPLPEMIAMFPEAKAELRKWTREDGSVMAYHRFGPEFVGQLSAGFNLWVKHETKASEVSPATIIVEQTATQKAA